MTTRCTNCDVEVAENCDRCDRCGEPLCSNCYCRGGVCEACIEDAREQEHVCG